MKAAPGWARASAIFGAVTIGFSQIFYNLILNNLRHFPSRAAFHLWTMAWFQALPVLALFGLDTLLVRRRPEGRLFRLWRAFLYTAAVFLFVRQIQIYHPAALHAVVPEAALAPLYALSIAAILALSLKRSEIVHRYFALLGALGVLLTLIYARGSGLFGAAWKEDSRNRAAGRTAAGAPAFIILFDELCARVMTIDGRIDAEAFPRFAQLAARSAWFPRATTNHFWTTGAIPTILTGRLAPRPDAPVFFERLPAGREVVLIEAWMAPDHWLRGRTTDSTRYIHRGVTEFVGAHPFRAASYALLALHDSPFVTSPFLERNRRLDLEAPYIWGDRLMHHWVEDEVEHLVRSIRTGESRGRLTYWHCSLPHFPFVFRHDGRRRPDDSDSTFRADRDSGLAWENYREQARYADAVLGRFLDALGEAGLYDDSIIVVTSDHGLRTNGTMEPPGWPDVMGDLVPGVPLLIHAPGVGPGRYETEVQHIDLAPTMLDLLGAKHGPGDFDGVSAWAPFRPAREKVIFDPPRKRSWVQDPASGLWKLRQP